ncbi:hypothetical protein [Chryseobacterium lathyri]|uniref:DUF4303 domain-containing protein n=1 Tax=Chryseobacterium lathyri TaxID=395933 RepID=A0ABT9SME1_9FLAO|nr:hypothetical protein [Chryseobacterium lathyri]MDP9960603.1 hypothetical protein [Chryseobacterium lathyri]
MESLKKINIELKKYLEGIKDEVIKDLVQMFKRENIDYLEGKSKTDIKALYFEYEYDYLDIVAWAADQKGNIITQTMVLPYQKKKQADKSETWNSFLPERIWAEASDFQEQYENEDDFDDLWDEYNEEKYKLFEDWFIECWKKVTELTQANVDAYFSIHDSYFKTDLNTFTTISDDEIAKRYTSG